MKRRQKSSSHNPYWNGEVCENPWNKNCENRDIVVYIDYNNEKRPICNSCWREIANSKYEWR